MRGRIVSRLLLAWPSTFTVLHAQHASRAQMHRFGYSFNDRIETWEDLRSRVRSFIVEMQRRHSGETVMVVTHGAVVSAFIDELVPSLSGMKHDVR